MATYKGTNGNDTYTGDGDWDFLYGFGGDDVLDGDYGNDVVVGGSGADTLTGGLGADVLWSGDESTADTPVGEDRGSERDVLHGGGDNDIIHAGYGDTVDGGDQSSSVGDRLFISFMGARAGVTVDFGVATQTVGGATITGIEHVEFCEGSRFDDTINVRDVVGGYFYSGKLYGLAGNDTLIAGDKTTLVSGGTGDDVIDGRLANFGSMLQGDSGDDRIQAGRGVSSAYGGDGDDTIAAFALTFGGAGNDTIEVLDGHGYTYAMGEDGDDTITAYGSTSLTISGGDGADVLTGGTGSDVINTGISRVAELSQLDRGAEIDRVYGGDGDDFILAGYGDFVDGGAGTDTLSLSLLGASAGLLVDTGRLIRQGGVIGGGRITGIEAVGSLTGTEFVDRIIIASLGTTVSGAGGNDRFIARDIATTAHGDAGDDYLASGVAVDTFDGGDGNDTVDYVRGIAAISVTLADTGAATASDGDRLTSVENLIGSRYADTFVGNSADNRLEGSTGDDSLAGAGGADALFGGNGDDTLAGGIGDDRLTGEAGDDVLDGGDGADVLNGGSGRDMLTGGAGSDTFRFLPTDLGRSAPTTDTITDFSQAERDRIMLVSGTDSRLEFIGTKAFSGAAGEVRFQKLGADTIISIDADGDSRAETYLRLTGEVALTARDFVMLAPNALAGDGAIEIGAGFSISAHHGWQAAEIAQIAAF